jgi:hypothetical protein
LTSAAASSSERIGGTSAGTANASRTSFIVRGTKLDSAG